NSCSHRPVAGPSSCSLTTRRRPTGPWLHSPTLAQKFARFRKRLVNFARVFASALRALRTSAAFSIYDRRDLLNQLVLLKLRSEFFRNHSEQCNVSVFCACDKNWAIEFWLKCVRDSL